MESGSTVDGVQITPLTSMAQQMAANMPGGMTEANIAKSHQAVGDFFNVNNILFTPPMDPTLVGSGSGADPDMMNDASDGHMNGMMGGGNVIMPPEAGTMGLADAMMEFVNSPMNRSGLPFKTCKPLLTNWKNPMGQFFPK